MNNSFARVNIGVLIVIVLAWTGTASDVCAEVETEPGSTQGPQQAPSQSSSQGAGQGSTSGSTSGSAPGSAQAATPAAAISKIEDLVKIFYPKAKVKKAPNSIHFEFKTKPFEIPPTNVVEAGPDWGGIVGDITQKSGHLSAEETVEKKLNQYSYYHVMEMRPNIPSSEAHMEVRLSYPFDVNPEFLQSFKAIIRSIDPSAQ